MKQKATYFAAQSALLILFLIVTMLQVLSFPGQIRHIREVSGISLLIEIALTIIVVSWLLMGQIALVCMWKIVGFMKEDHFFTKESMLWINRVVIALKTAVLFPIALFFLLIPQADDPGFFVMLTAVGTFLFTLTIFATLLRDQIRKKIEF